MRKRPEILFPLFQELTGLDGIGPRLAKNFSTLYIERPRDLLFTLPYSCIERFKVSSVKDAVLPKNLILDVKVISHIPPRVKSRPYKVTVKDEQIIFGLIFFHANTKFP